MSTYNASRPHPASSRRDNVPINGRSGGKARRIAINFSPNPTAAAGPESADQSSAEGGVVTAVSGTKKPYPDWKNQHGPTGASADGITEEEAEAMVALTARMLSTTLGLGKELEINLEDDGDDEEENQKKTLLDGTTAESEDDVTIREGAFMVRAIDNTVAGGSPSTAAFLLVGNSSGKDKDGSNHLKGKAAGNTTPKLTAAERAAKMAEEMEAKAEADRSEHGLLYTAQEAARQRQLQQQQQETNGKRMNANQFNRYFSDNSRPSSTAKSYGVSSTYGGFSRPVSAQRIFGGEGHNEDEGDSTNHEGDDGLTTEVVEFNVTTPGGLAAHILATGGYGCPNPSKPNPTIPKHHALSFAEDEARGARTPPTSHLHVGTRVGKERDGEKKDNAVASNNALIDPSAAASANSSPTSRLGVGLGTLSVTQHHPHATYSPIRMGKKLGADRVLSPMKAVQQAGGSSNARGYLEVAEALGGTTGATGARFGARLSLDSAGSMPSRPISASGTKPHHLAPLASAAATTTTSREQPSPTRNFRKMRISDVALSKQPWDFQDAVLDAQILKDAKMDKENIKLGYVQDEGDDEYMYEGGGGGHGNSEEQRQQHLTSLEKVAGRNPKAAMLLPRGSSDGSRTVDAIYQSLLSGTALGEENPSTTRCFDAPLGLSPRRLYDANTGTIPLDVLESVAPHIAKDSSDRYVSSTNTDNEKSFEISGGGRLLLGPIPHPSNYNNCDPLLSSGSTSLASIAAGSPFMKRKQLIGERILRNTFQSVAERERKAQQSNNTAAKRRTNNGAVDRVNSDSSRMVDNEHTNATTSGGEEKEEERFGSTLRDFTANLLSNAPGSVIGKGIVVRNHYGKGTMKTLPPSSMTSREVFIAQQRLLNAKLRDMYENGNGRGSEGSDGAGFGIEPEDLPDDDSEDTLSKQYDHLLPFLQAENTIETRRFLCELWSKHIALACSVEAFSLMVAKNRARDTIRHVAIPMVMRWIKTYRRNKAIKSEINARVDEVLAKRPNAGVLRKNNKCLSDWSDAMIDSLLLYAHFVPYRQDQFVLFQGEPSREVYLVVSGEVEVIVMDRSAIDKKKIKSRRSENGKVVANLGPGMFFGELASMTSQPRCASARCITDCDLLCLSHTDFARAGSPLPERSWQLLKNQCRLTRVENIGKVFPLKIEDVQKHAMFAHWGHSAAETLVEQFTPIFVPENEYLFSSPMVNENACVIIVSGKVKVTSLDKDGNPYGEPAFFSPGDILGEKETVMIVRRNFNAVCVEPVEGYLLTRGGYVSAASQNATYAAKSREIVAGRIANAWVRPPPPKNYLEDPILSYLVSEDVLLKLWELATPRLVWQSELMLLAGQPCEYISVVTRGTFHERAATTRSSATSGGGSGGHFPRGSRTTTPFTPNFPGHGNGASPLSPHGSVAGAADIQHPRTGSVNAVHSAFTETFATGRTSQAHVAQPQQVSSVSNLSPVALMAVGASYDGTGVTSSSDHPLFHHTRNYSNASSSIVTTIGFGDEWDPVTDAAFLPPHLRRLEQRATHRQYDDGLDDGDAVLFGPLEIGVNHKYYLRTVWCTGSCHVWQIPRAAFEALVKKEHPRVWNAIISPKTMETILENAENLSRLANDSNPPRRAGI